MRVNPGGKIPPEEVLGRDKLIQRLWRVLERQSVVLSAERRMGKTCIVKKMTAECPGDKLAVYRELEGVRSPLEFAQIVFDDVAKYLGRLEKSMGQVKALLKNLTGAEIAGIVKFPDSVAQEWKTLLRKTIEDLVANQYLTVIFFWDEMPLMLDNIKADKGEPVAMELLDELRSLRQTYDSLRMVYTGSIGLQNVLTSLKRVGYKNAPINDMLKEDVPPLSPADGQNLAYQLLVGEKIPADNIGETVRAIALCADYIPYYIHHLVDEIGLLGEPANATMAQRIITRYLIDPEDRWDLRHYRDRIDNYYQDKEIPLALNLLDSLALADTALSLNELHQQLQSRLSDTDIEQIRDVLALIERDHYIIRDETGKFRFRYPLIQHYWQLHRGLE